MGDMRVFRRARRELSYSLLGSLAGAAGFFLVAFTILPGLVLSVTVVFTVIGLALAMFSLSLAVRIGSLHRRLLARFLGDEVPPPAPFRPVSGLLGRVDKRLRYKAGWRAVLFAPVKLPVAVIQAIAVGSAVDGLLDITYPVVWLLFRNHKAGTHLSPLHTLSPVQPLTYAVTSWPGTFVAALTGVVYVAAGIALSRAINGADRRLIRALLGPNRRDERVTQLERTRTLAVEDAAAALRRVERDLHDGAQMRLAALAMNLGMAQEKLAEADDATVRELLGAAHRNAVDALADLRDLARGIHPPALDNGLAVAFESLAASSAIPTTVAANLPERPAQAIETIAYFCAAELIANATKHSYANQIKIDISAERQGVLRLRVCDDGIGGADQARGSGLAGLAQRVSTVDGRLDVRSPEGGPTEVTVELPMKA
jgi:signal transduction histidine kinase